jgi:hypothetical protein
MKKKIIIGISCAIILILVITSAYIIFYLKKPTTMLYIYPQAIKGTIGQVFTVNISVSEVADLYGWQTKLEWNPQILEVVNVTEGNFLKNHGSTYFNEKFNETGYLLLDCTLIGDLPGARGSGILTTIQFSVKGSGSCNLQLSETTLINSAEQLIQHTVKNGQFST